VVLLADVRSFLPPKGKSREKQLVKTGADNLLA